jgi:hypothetical protein
MPFAFIIAGILLLVTGARQKSQTLISLLASDFSGQNNLVYWVLSILILGGLGYIHDLRTVSRAFLILVIVVLILNEDKNGNGFFTEFQSAIQGIGTMDTNSLGEKSE